MGTNSKSKQLELLVALVFFLLPFMMMGHLFSFWGCYPEGEEANRYFPLAGYLAEQLGRFELPQWNPYVGLGSPFFANPETGVFYPPNWLLGVMPLGVGFLVLNMLHFGWGGYGVYRMLRFGSLTGESLGIIGASVGGLIFMFGGVMVGIRGSGTLFYASAWSGWALLAWSRYLTHRRFSDVGWIVATQTFMLLSGGWSAALLIMLLCGVVALTRHVERKSAVLLTVVVSVALTVILSAVQLIPTVELIRECVMSGKTAESLTIRPMPLHLLAGAAFPYLFGSEGTGLFGGEYWGLTGTGMGPEMRGQFACYLSWAGILFGSLAVVMGVRSRRSVRFWLMVAFTGLVGAFGLGQLNSVWIPGWPEGLEVPLVPGRLLLLFSLGVSVLAGMGVHLLIRAEEVLDRDRRLKAGRRLVRLTVLIFLILLFVWVGLAGWFYFQSSGDDSGVRRPIVEALRPTNPAVWVSFCMLLATGGAGWRLSRVRFAFGSKGSGKSSLASATSQVLLLWVVIGLDVFLFARSYQHDMRKVVSSDRVSWFPPPLPVDESGSVSGPRVRGILVDGKAVSFSGYRPWRNLLFAQPMLNHPGPLIPAAVRRIMPNIGNGIEMVDGRLLSLFGVRFALGAKPNPPSGLPGGPFTPVPGGKPAYLFLNSNARPMVYFSDSVLMAPRGDLIFRRLKNDPPASRGSPSRQTIVESKQAWPFLGLQAGRIEQVDDAPGDLTVLTGSEHRGLLVLNQLNYPGWEAAIDGRKVEIYPANGAVQGILVPPGRHRITFQFSSTGLLVGAAVSICGMILLLIIALYQIDRGIRFRDAREA